jgi:hypothetical protein
MKKSNEVQNITNVGNEELADVMARFILINSKELPDGFEGVVFGLENDFNGKRQKLVMYTNNLKPLKIWWVNVP